MVDSDLIALVKKEDRSGFKALYTPRLLNTTVAIALIITVRTLAVIRKWSLPVIR